MVAFGVVALAVAILEKTVLGRASRPSKMRASNKSRNRIVSNTHRSSPYNAFSIESKMLDSSISLVMESELRHSVDKRPVSVEIETMVVDFWRAVELFRSFDAFRLAFRLLPAFAGWELWLVLLLELVHLLTLFSMTESPSFLMSSSMRPYLARGSGSMPLRMNRSDREAKHLSAPSATKLSFLNRK